MPHPCCRWRDDIPSPALVAASEIGANGLLDHASVRGAGAFFARTGRDAPFLNEVPFRFRVRNAAGPC